MKNPPLSPGLVLLVILACSTAALSAQQDDDRDVVIRRDAFGVPHSHGRTDAAAAYGYAYAQAEDNFWQIEENFLRATGQAALVNGRDALLDDWINGSLQVPELARREYANAEPDLKAILEAYAAGVNDWVAQSKTPFRALDRVEPWHPLALIRYLYFQRGFLGAARLRGAEYRAAFEQLNPGIALTADLNRNTDNWLAQTDAEEVWPYRAPGQGSNSWAVRPGRSASGAALLFINPHLPHFGPSQVYEAHLSSDTGWNFTGYGRFGFPMPYVGTNPDLGWASTDNAADLTDVYREQFDDPSDPLAYRYGDGQRQAQEWTTTVHIAGGDSIELRHRATHHGPVVARREGQWLAVRMAKLDQPGWLAQWYAMSRSRSLEEFLAAVEPLNMLFGNYTYADRAGNILYVYNAAVPRRDEAFDWTEPVDGADPRTEWQGFHPMSELPQLLNPATGWLQNCNSSPFLSTSTGNPRREDFPSYMANENDTARAASARRLLTSRATFEFDEWGRLSYDTYLQAADALLPALFAAWEQAEEPPARLREPIEVMQRWNRRAALESVATTLFILWGEAGGLRAETNVERLDALTRALDQLEDDWGAWQIPWGEMSRAQRVHSSGDRPFRDDLPSHPVAGAPSWAGASFTFWSLPVDGLKRRYAVGGNSYVAIVEFGERVRVRSLMPFGQSADSTSPHHQDQLPLYATGYYKQAWLHLDDVQANTVEARSPHRLP